MRKEEFFEVLGDLDDGIVRGAEAPAKNRAGGRAAPSGRLKWAALAACLALSLLLWGMRPSSPPVEPNPPVVEPAPPITGENVWDEGPRIHFLSFQLSPEEQARFYLYIDKQDYDASWQDGVYTIRPKESIESLPPCVMEVAHLDAAPEQAARTVRESLEGRYASVTEIEEAADEIAWKFPANTLYCFMASDGLAWDSAQRETFLVDDGQGGVFAVSYGYFMEAAEGHGTRFAGMAASFRVIPNDRVAAWMTELDDTVEKLIRAVFSGGLEDVEDLLLPSAVVDRYGAGTAGGVVIHRIDKVINHETAPTAAIVTIPYSLSPEEPGGTLEMELRCDEGRWLAWRIELKP